MKKTLLISLLFISISAIGQRVVKGPITEIHGDTVTVSGERFIIHDKRSVGDTITLTATNISNRFTRRKKNAKKAETENIGAMEFVKND